MVRFLTLAVCSLALLLGLLQVATHYTITLTVRPVESPSGAALTSPAEPATRNKEPDAPTVKPRAKAAPAASQVDSHHTKGA